MYLSIVNHLGLHISIVQALSVDNVIRRHQRVNQGNRNRQVRFGKGKQRNCILCTTPNIRSRAITIHMYARDVIKWFMPCACIGIEL